LFGSKRSQLFRIRNLDGQRYRRELAEWLYQGLSLLDERCRRLLLALYFDAEQPSYAQIADHLKIPIGSVGPTRARCLEQMRQSLHTAESPVSVHRLHPLL